jgi:hypothetical protein
MNWETRLKLLLKKNNLNQQEYDEFVAIGNTLKTNEDLEKYKQYGEGIYLLLGDDINTEDDVV